MPRGRWVWPLLVIAAAAIAACQRSGPPVVASVAGYEPPREAVADYDRQMLSRGYSPPANPAATPNLHLLALDPERARRRPEVPGLH
jgi:hypothetical protein